MRIYFLFVLPFGRATDHNGVSVLTRSTVRTVRISATTAQLGATLEWNVANRFVALLIVGRICIKYDIFLVITVFSVVPRQFADIKFYSIPVVTDMTLSFPQVLRVKSL